MRRALLLDTETTGLDPTTDRVIEVAVILFDLELGCPIESYASLIQASGNAAESANGIPPAALAVDQAAHAAWRVAGDVHACSWSRARATALTLAVPVPDRSLSLSARFSRRSNRLRGMRRPRMIIGSFFLFVVLFAIVR